MYLGKATIVEKTMAQLFSARYEAQAHHSLTVQVRHAAGAAHIF